MIAEGPNGERRIAFSDFHRLPGDTPDRDTNLNADELITAIELPAKGFSKNYTYLKIRDRLSYAFALVSVAASLELDGGVIKEARLALGGVAHKPWRDETAEAELVGEPSGRSRFQTGREHRFAGCQGPRAQRLQDRPCPPRHCPGADAGGEWNSANTGQQENPVSAMTTYIGTAVPRVDGKAKVTGAAKYAGEFNVPGLAHGAVVTSTVAKGKITAIDTSAALAVEGVLSVLTHENRPPMAESDSAYKDDVAPEGSPFRPLYNAMSCSASSRLRWSWPKTGKRRASPLPSCASTITRKSAPPTCFQQRGNAFTLAGKAFAMSLANPRGDAADAFAAVGRAARGRLFLPVEHHNPMELYASTAIWEGDGKLTVYDKTQGVQNVQRYLCGVFGAKSEDIRVLSPFVGGGVRIGLAPAI